MVVRSQCLENLEKDTYVLMNYLLQWCKINFLNFNEEKTVFMLIHTRIKCNWNFNIFVDERQLEEVNALKYLGLYLDNKLNFEMHCDKIRSKIASSIFVLRMLSKFCDKKLLLLAYHALVESHINYCINTWSCASNKQIEKIFILQKKSIRTILKLKQDTSCREHFIKNEILTLPAKIIMSHLKLLAKRLKGDKAETHGYGTRYHQFSSLSKNDTYLTKAWKFFDKLPNIIQESIYSPTFGKLATRHLIAKCPYSINEFLNVNE